MAHEPRSSRMRALAALSGATLAMLAVSSVSAQVPATEHTVTGVAGYGAWDWISLTFRIGLVLAIIWGSVMAMRWYVRRVGGEGVGRARALQIVETRSLGPNRSLHLVRIGNKAVLIGATAERINPLMEIADPTELEHLFLDDAAPARPMASVLSGLATMSSYAGGALRAVQSGRAAQGGPERVSQPRGAGVLTGLLTNLGRRMHRTSAPRPGTLARPARDEVHWDDRQSPGLFAGILGDTQARAGMSLFDRTLADASTAAAMPAPAARPMPRAIAAAPSAAGLRAMSGYAQATPSIDEVAHEARLTELQRAIEYARRSAS